MPITKKKNKEQTFPNEQNENEVNFEENVQDTTKN